MAAPQIPNLLDSLRNSKGPRAGSASRGRAGPGPSPGTRTSTDAIIQQTDDDAAGSRMSAVDIGYLDDPFAKFMTHSQQRVRRMPIINRGTYVRTVAIDSMLKQFFRSHPQQQLQIISLGAGTDTRPFRVLQTWNSKEFSGIVYHEIDFPACTSRKITAIKNAGFLPSSGLEISEDGTRLSSVQYNLHPLDLRDLAFTAKTSDDGKEEKSRLEAKLPGFDSTKPTLLLSECCFTYIDSFTVISILRTMLQGLDGHVLLLLYEPLHPDDAFGRTMKSNLSARGISLPGLDACPTVEAHQKRLEQCGFESTRGTLIKDLWRLEVTEDEKARLRSLEGLDEEEEWELLAGHYAVVVAERGHEDASTPT